MSNAQRMRAITIIDNADSILLSMKGQMQMTRDYAERNGGDPEFNDLLHVSVSVQTMIDAVRCLLDDAAQCFMNDQAAAAAE